MKINRLFLVSATALCVLLNSATLLATPNPTPVEQSQTATAKLPQININTADTEMLQTIKGVGQKKAEAIVEYRKQHGEFKTIEDLKNVAGIGDTFLTKIRAQITI